MFPSPKESTWLQTTKICGGGVTSSELYSQEAAWLPHSREVWHKGLNSHQKCYCWCYLVCIWRNCLNAGGGQACVLSDQRIIPLWVTVTYTLSLMWNFLGFFRVQKGLADCFTVSKIRLWSLLHTGLWAQLLDNLNSLLLIFKGLGRVSFNVFEKAFSISYSVFSSVMLSDSKKVSQNHRIQYL